MLAAELLLQAGAAVNGIQSTQTPSPLQFASMKPSCYDMAKVLVDNGASAAGNPVLASGRSPLQLAVQDDNIELAQLLLKNGADVNACDHRRILPRG